MKIAESNNFRLDSNIDGTYIDSESNVLTISNMIQIVGATDGPVAYPGSADPKAPFTATEFDSFSTYEDLTVAVHNLGHGLIYDEEGRPIAHKGELVFRDGLGNVASLSRLVSNVNSIYEDGANVYLRDKSLQDYNRSDLGVGLDQVINRSIENATTLNAGNIVQAARGDKQNDTSVSVWTVDLSENNVVWIVGHAEVNQETLVQVRDVNTDTVLTTGYIKPEQDNYTPCNVSWIGTLEVSPIVSDGGDGCSTAIWDSAKKKHFVLKEDADPLNIHEIVLETVSPSGSEFLQGCINILCIDNDIDADTQIENGTTVFDGVDVSTVEFETEMPDETYSISLQAQEYNQLWYTNKSATGFDIRSEREYVGSVFWTATHIT